MTIYQVTKEYLIKHFDPSCHTCDFSDLHTQELNARIHEIDPSYQAKNFEKKEQVRLAFVDFYIDVAKVAVFFKGLEKIIVKTTPYETHPDEHAFIARIGEYVQSIVVELDEVNDSDEVLLIPEEHLQAMHALLHTISIPVDARQLIRRAIHDAFKLSEKDMILFINKKVLIKFYCDEEVESSCERRFEGIPQEEVEVIVRNLYVEDGENSLETDIEMVMATLMDTTMDFSKIDNHAFITHHIRLIQNALVNFMKTKLSHPEIVINGVAKYIFREAFYFIHEMMAEKLLELLGNNNKNAERFLKFYNGEVVILEGKKFSTPEIVDENGKQWSIPAITAFISKYTRENSHIQKREKQVLNYAREQKETNEKYSALLQEKKELVQELGKSDKELKRVEKVGSRQDLEELSAYTQKLETTRNEVEQRITSSIESMQLLEEKILKEKTELNEYLERFNPLAEEYDNLIAAVSKAMMAR